MARVSGATPAGEILAAQFADNTDSVQSFLGPSAMVVHNHFRIGDEHTVHDFANHVTVAPLDGLAQFTAGSPFVSRLNF